MQRSHLAPHLNIRTPRRVMIPLFGALASLLLHGLLLIPVL